MEDEEVPVQNDSSGALSKLLAQSNAIAAQQPGVGGGRGGLAAAAALLAPTKTGHWSESLSRGLSAEAEQNASDAKLRAQYAQTIMKALMPATVGRSLMDPMTGRVLATDPSVAEERRAKMLELQLRLNENAAGREERIAATAEQREADRASRAEIAEAARAAAAQRAAEALADRQAGREQNAELRRELTALIAATRPDPAPTLTTVVGPDGKTPVVKDARTDRIIGNAPERQKPVLPNSAVSAELEDLEIIGGLAGVNKDLEEFERKIGEKDEKGVSKLDLGLWSNLTSQVRNRINASTPQSQEFASFKAAMERARNQSLLLNKGVQTEGDAQRAWNELFESMNDSGVVAKRLAEIRKINERAARIKKLSVDSRRQNFGADPYNFEEYLSQQAAIIDAKPKGLGTNAVQGRVGEVQPDNRGVTKPKNPLPDGFSWEK